MNPEKSANATISPPAYNEAYQQGPPTYASGGQAPPPAGHPQASYPQTTYVQSGYPVQGGYTVAGVAGTQPVYAYQPQVVVGPPENHAALAWFSCLCCFWPLGLVAIIKSNEVNSAAQRGDVNGAQIASRSARQFSLISVGIGVASWIIAVIFIILYVSVFASLNNRNYNG